MRNTKGLIIGAWLFAATGAFAGAEAPLEVSRPAYAGGEWKRYQDWPQTAWKSFPNMSSPGSAAPAAPSSGGLTGDPAKGRAVAEDTRKGNCYACHTAGRHGPDRKTELPGNVGPDISSLAGRDPDYLRGRLTDPTVLNPAALMPPFGRNGILSAQEIEDVVSYLKTLDTKPSFATPLDDPNARPAPVETRDWRDEFVNPAAAGIARGAGLFQAPGPTGRSCLSCHSAPEKSFQSWAAAMPKPEPRMGGKVLGVEEFLTRHARATTGAEFPMTEGGNVDLSIYMRSLADGRPISADTTTPLAAAAVARGRALTEKRVGQLNFACQGCHTTGAERFMRGQWLGSMDAGSMTAHFPTYRTSKDQIWDIRKRFQWCNVQVRADELPPDAPEYGDLEMYLTSIAKGKKLSAPGIRH